MSTVRSMCKYLSFIDGIKERGHAISYKKTTLLNEKLMEETHLGKMIR